MKSFRVSVGIVLCIMMVHAVPTMAARFYKPIDMNGNVISNVALPTASDHAATKAYVDAATNAASSGVTKAYVDAATNGAVATAAGDASAKASAAQAAAEANAAGDATMKANAAEANAIGAAAGDATMKAGAAEANAIGTAALDATAKADAAQAAAIATAAANTAAATNGLALDFEPKFVKRAGDTMTGALDMNTNTISSVAAPVNPLDAANKAYVDAKTQNQVTLLKYADINRTDTYTPDGSITKPFKTIQAAIDSITDAGGGKRYAIVVAPGSYAENITLKPFVNISGSGREYVKLYGSITGDFAAPGVRVVLADLDIYGDITWTPRGSTSKLGLEYCFASKLTFNGAEAPNDYLDVYESSFWDAVAVQSGQVNFIRCELYYTLDAANAAVYVINGACSDVVTLNGGAAAKVTDVNTDPIYTEFVVNNGATLDIDASTASDVPISGAGVINLKEAASAVRNDSSVVGATVKDALNTLGSGTLPAVSNAFVLKSGDTMTGALTLPGVPTTDNHAANKAYVDTATNAAVATAAADATAKASAAQANAEANAAGDATLKANAAEANAIGAAAGDATMKAGAAEANAIGTAALDATAKADAAQAAAIATAAATTAAATNGLALDFEPKFVKRVGDTMTGSLTIEQQKIILDHNPGTPSKQSYIIGKDNRVEVYVDDELSARF